MLLLLLVLASMTYRHDHHHEWNDSHGIITMVRLSSFSLPTLLPIFSFLQAKADTGPVADPGQYSHYQKKGFGLLSHCSHMSFVVVVVVAIVMLLCV